jgi:hypothetical protein
LICISTSPIKSSVGGEYVPDYDYSLIYLKILIISSQDGNSFLSEDKIDFSISSSQDPTIVSVYQIAGSNPQYFLLKKTRKAISATVNTVNHLILLIQFLLTQLT